MAHPKVEYNYLQKIIEFNSDKDIIALAMDEEDAVVQVFFVRDGKLIGRDHFFLRAAAGDQKEQVLLSFIKQFYMGTPFIPRELVLQSAEIYDVLRRPARQIADEVQSVLEVTSPELVGDIAQNGITLTGGGCQIWGMDLLLQERTGIKCRVADDPDSCVAYGCGKSLNWMNQMQEGPINIARRRLMQG